MFQQFFCVFVSLLLFTQLFNLLKIYNHNNFIYIYIYIFVYIYFLYIFLLIYFALKRDYGHSTFGVVYVRFCLQMNFGWDG